MVRHPMEVENLIQFNEIINLDKFTAVHFYMPGCPPCRVFALVFTRCCAEFTEVDFVKVNVDVAVDVRSRYEISVAPTIMVFRNGRIVDGCEYLSPREFPPELEALAR